MTRSGRPFNLAWMVRAMNIGLPSAVFGIWSTVFSSTAAGTGAGGPGLIPDHAGQFPAHKGVGFIEFAELPGTDQSPDHESAALTRHDFRLALDHDIAGDGADGIGHIGMFRQHRFGTQGLGGLAAGRNGSVRRCRPPAASDRSGRHIDRFRLRTDF